MVLNRMAWDAALITPRGGITLRNRYLLRTFKKNVLSMDFLVRVFLYALLNRSRYDSLGVEPAQVSRH